MEAVEDCRICSDEGLYNIFNDELCFDEENNKTKIYVVLNNFQFEKLYAPDTHSSFICRSCCDSMCDSYSFMLKVRNAEYQLKFKKAPTAKKAEVVKEQEPKTAIEEEAFYLRESSVDTSDVEDNFEAAIDDSVEIERLVEKPPPQVLRSPPRKKLKPAQNSIPESIIFSHYELSQYKENEQNEIFINVAPLTVERPLDGTNYEFDSTWVSHADSSSIYKCKHCVKAFSNAEFLLKHTTSVHLCIHCLETFENYKDLVTHAKLHCDIDCHFCGKKCGSSANFRQHLKKQHQLNIPNHVGILQQE